MPYLTLMTEEAPQREHSLRAVFNAPRWMVRTGAAWRMLPHNFPPWQTVYGYYWRRRKSRLWDRLNAALVPAVRQQAGRQAQPSAAIIDSQNVKTAEGGEARGADVHKQVNGRKRPIVVDVLGLLCWWWSIVLACRIARAAKCSWRNSLRGSSAVSTTDGAV